MSSCSSLAIERSTPCKLASNKSPIVVYAIYANYYVLERINYRWMTVVQMMILVSSEFRILFIFIK